MTRIGEGALAVALVAALATHATAGEPGGDALTATSRSALAAADTTAEPVLMEVWLGRFLSATVQAYRVGDDALLPLVGVLELAEVRVVVTPERELRAVLGSGRGLLSLSPRGDTLRIRAERIALDPHAVLFAHGEVYLSARVLERALASPVVVSWADLAVTIADATSLPVGQRMRRESTRAAYLSLATGLPGLPDSDVELERPHFDGMVLDYSLSVPSGRPLAGGSAFLAMGANVLGGALEASHAQPGHGTGAHARSSASWLGVWPDGRWLRQLRVGDGGSAGPRFRAIRGVALSNSPYVRPLMFGALRYPGSFEPGWEVEVYRDGQLVAFDTADSSGRFGVELPVFYGQNPVELHAFGPHGETRMTQQQLHIREDRLPEGALEYSGSFGACRANGCTQAANVDVRYGLSQRWTVRAGGEEYLRKDAPNLLHPYAGAAGSVTNALGVRVDAIVHALVRAELHFEPTSRLRLVTEAVHFSSAVDRPLLSPAGWRSMMGGSAMLRPASWHAALLTADAQHITTTSGTITRARLGGSARHAGVQLLPHARAEWLGGASASHHPRSWFGASLYAVPGGARRRINRLWMRAAVEFEEARRLSSASAFVAHPLPNGVRVEAGAGWARGDAAQFGVTISTDLPQLRALTSATGRRGDWNGVQSVQGSVLWNSASRDVSLAAGPSLQRAGVTGRVFMDVNGNGVFDDEDEPLAGVTVRVGGTGAVTDERGIFQAWNVTPYVALGVKVDSATLASPLWVPADGMVSVVPGANRFATVQLPIVPGGVVEGAVLRDGDPAAGVRVVLTNVGTGERRLVTTFSDGEFLLLGVPPGRYDLNVAEGVQERLRARAESVRIEVRAMRDGDSVHGVVIRLQALD